MRTPRLLASSGWPRETSHLWLWRRQPIPPSDTFSIYMFVHGAWGKAHRYKVQNRSPVAALWRNTGPRQLWSQQAGSCCLSQGLWIVVFDPYLQDRMEWSLCIWKVYNSQDLLYESDCISLHCNLKEHSHISDFTIKQTRQSILHEHGGLVDEKTLAWTLKEGRLPGAALHVPESESTCMSSIIRGQWKDVPNLI